MSDLGVPANTIVVVGEGSANVTTDAAVLSVSLGISASSPGEALAGVSERSQAVLTVARERGLPDSDLKTRALTVVPEMDHASRRILGYLASYTLEVRLRTLDEAPRIIDALVATAGEALRLGGFHLAPSSTESAWTEASSRAVQDARARAERLAGAAGVRVGRVLSIAEEATMQPGHLRQRMAAVALPPTAGPMLPVEPGSDEVDVRVRVTFELAD